MAQSPIELAAMFLCFQTHGTGQQKETNNIKHHKTIYSARKVINTGATITCPPKNFTVNGAGTVEPGGMG